MTYEEAKTYQQKLEDENKVASIKLREFDKLGKTNLGLTPDHVKALPEWQIAKKESKRAFAELRNFNGWFVKVFKREYAAERRKRYKNKNITKN